MVLLLVFLLFKTSDAAVEKILTDKLFNQAQCWNSGDIDCFMNDYWHHDSLMYIGKNGITYGWENTLQRYKSTYPTSAEMGHLEFTILKLESLSSDTYLMVGKWHLERKIGNIQGHFSLIWKKINNDWVIIADHSS